MKRSFFRWSVIKLAWSTWFDDGREEEAVDFVLAHVQKGDIDAVIAALDRFAYEKQFLLNIGDEKGALLDSAVLRAQPRRVLELGTYLGYSALRIARRLPPDGRVYSLESNANNARRAREIIERAGMTERISVLHGRLDEALTMSTLRSLGFAPGTLDLVFIDHDKKRYVSDLERILDADWLHPGSVVIADNVRMPGAPEYRAFMEAEEGARFHTRAHETHAEYQTLLRDTVLESTLLAR